jgi:hypothetical protein
MKKTEVGRGKLDDRSRSAVKRIQKLKKEERKKLKVGSWKLKAGSWKLN